MKAAVPLVMILLRISLQASGLLNVEICKRVLSYGPILKTVIDCLLIASFTAQKGNHSKKNKASKIQKSKVVRGGGAPAGGNWESTMMEYRCL
jgi:large-conductance mechanosensitive channel